MNWTRIFPLRKVKGFFLIISWPNQALEFADNLKKELWFGWGFFAK